MPTPNVLILRAPGTNCDGETTHAFEKAGATTTSVHINALRDNPALLKQSQILALPGGFSYGDDVGAGKILAKQLSHFLADAMREFRNEEKLIIGICNGFQTLLKAGLLVPHDDDGPLATLSNNEHGYRDSWVHLQASPGKCVFLKGITNLHVPVAHGEGNFICRKEWILHGLAQTGQIVLRYVSPTGQPATFPENPNGSQGDVAGITDFTGRVLGLMPHPERHMFPTQNPQWTRQGLKKEGDGLAIFRNAVEYFKD